MRYAGLALLAACAWIVAIVIARVRQLNRGEDE